MGISRKSKDRSKKKNRVLNIMYFCSSVFLNKDICSFKPNAVSLSVKDRQRKRQQFYERVRVSLKDKAGSTKRNFCIWNRSDSQNQRKMKREREKWYRGEDILMWKCWSVTNMCLCFGSERLPFLTYPELNWFDIRWDSVRVTHKMRRLKERYKICRDGFLF